TVRHGKRSIPTTNGGRLLSATTTTSGSHPAIVLISSHPKTAVCSKLCAHTSQPQAERAEEKNGEPIQNSRFMGISLRWCAAGVCVAAQCALLWQKRGECSTPALPALAIGRGMVSNLAVVVVPG